MVADAVMAIWKKLGVKPCEKWVDDVVTFRFPISSARNADGLIRYRYSYDRDSMKGLIVLLGVPWHLLKGQDYGFVFVYVGFFWDLIERSVRLTDGKRLKVMRKLSVFLERFSNAKVPIKEATSLNGSLSHISFVYPHGRTYLTSLSSFLATFDSIPTNHPKLRWLSRSVIHDLRWWLNLLQQGSVPRSLRQRTVCTDLGIWVDASTSWGVGLVWAGREYAAWKWKDGWNDGAGCDIGWGEAIAVELAILLVEVMVIRDAEVLIRSDNQGVIGAFGRGRSRNWMVNRCIQRSDVVGMALNTVFKFEFVASEDNLADPFSRGEQVPGFIPLSHHIPLPEPLYPFLHE